MEQYDVKCPACGAENKNLYLKETDGWFVCEHCQLEVKAAEFTRPSLIRVFTMDQLAKAVSHS